MIQFFLNKCIYHNYLIIRYSGLLLISFIYLFLDLLIILSYYLMSLKKSIAFTVFISLFLWEKIYQYFPKQLIKYPTVPSLVFAVLSFLAALLVLILPETHKRPLPNTIEEVESWTRTVAVNKNPDQNETTLQETHL